MIEKEELMLICGNCTFFFPENMEGFTDYGICLRDKIYEPYLDALTEDYNYDPCKELIEKNKIHGHTEACKHFEEPEECDIDDVIHFGEKFKNQINTGKFDADAFETDLLLDQLEKADWSTIPLDKHIIKLNSPDKSQQFQAILNLVFFANSGNKEAFDQLIQYFKDLPCPITLDDVHFKIEVLRHFGNLKNNSIIIPFLINELYHIESNNTTRQWVSKILKHLEYCPIDMVCIQLQELLKDRKFSHKLKNKIKDTIFECYENQSNKYR